MDKQKEEKILRVVVRFFVGVLISVIVLNLMGRDIPPGITPLSFFLCWIAQWRLFHIRGLFPGGIYTFIYLLIAVLTFVIAANQIMEVI